MRHPFDGINPANQAAPEAPPHVTRRSVLGTLLTGVAGLFGLAMSARAAAPPVPGPGGKKLTEVLHENGPGVTTMALGEEGGSTRALKEEGGGISTAARNEEGGATTEALKEEGGRVSTKASAKRAGP